MTRVEAWRPDVDAAVAALGSRGLINPQAERAAMHGNDVRAVLDASGATVEIERLRAVLAAAHCVMETLRAELRGATRVVITLPAVTDAVAAPGHVDGWQTGAELVGDPGPDVLAEVQAAAARAENEAAWSTIRAGR